MQAFLFSLCLVGIFGGLLPLLWGYSPSDRKFALGVSLVPFAVWCWRSEWLIVVLWALYLGLIAASLWGVGKARTRRMRILGHIGIVIAFGTLYAIGWFLTLSAVAAAIAFALMSRS